MTAEETKALRRELKAAIEAEKQKLGEALKTKKSSPSQFKIRDFVAAPLSATSACGSPWSRHLGLSLP